MQRSSLVEGTSASNKQLQGFQKVSKRSLKSGEYGQNMPREGSRSLARSASSGAERTTSQPFLTDEQRSALDAALASKQREPVATLRPTSSSDASIRTSGGSTAAANADNVRNSAIKAVPTTRAKGTDGHDRHWSRGAKGLGKAKKGGAGGKYTWGGMLVESEDGEPMDHNDPNYNSDDDGMPVSLEYEYADDLQGYKFAVMEIVDEYFNNGDVKEAAAALLDISQPQLHHWFVKKAVTMAMDRHDKEREMICSLLSSLYSVAVAPDQMQKGFQSLVAAVEDLSLDVPAAAELLAVFISRAIVDEILPPSFVGSLPTGPEKAQTEVKRGCEVRLAGRHAAEKLQRCWGCSATSSLDETRASIANLLKEFEASHDADEADRCLRGLNMPFFHHELVKQLLLACMSHPAQEDSFLQLVQHLAASGELSLSQLVKGFHRVQDNLEDICLDNPRGVEQLQHISARGISEGWLDADWDTQSLSLRSVSSTQGAPHTIQAFKVSAAGITKEYFQSEDASDAALSLTDLDESQLHDVFVKQAVMQGMECKARERELVSCLLAYLHSSALTTEQAAAGFTRLLIAAEDLVLDFPDAAHQLTLFLARAVADGVLPSTFLQSVLPSLSDASLGVSVVQSAGRILGARGAAERLRTCWGAPTARSTEQLQLHMQEILTEYLASGKGNEARKALLELGVPAYHHELVSLVFNAATANPSSEPRLIALLDLLAQSGTVSQTQMIKGFERVQQQLSNAAAGGATAQTCFATFQQHAESHGWLPVEAPVA